MKKLILFELRKVFSKRLALIALIGIILFSALLSFSTFQNKYAFDQNIGEGTGKTAVEIDKEIAAKYEGILTDEKVQQMMSDFAPTSDLHGLSAIYVYQNAMQSAAFSRFSDKEGNWNGLSVSDVFGNEEIKIGYVDGWLSTSRNMVRVFVALALAVIGLVRKYTRTRKLTPRMLNELVEKIEVFNAEKIDGVWEQRLRIHYNCVGTIEIPTVLPLPIPEVSVNTRKGVVVNYAPCELAV